MHRILICVLTLSSLIFAQQTPSSSSPAATGLLNSLVAAGNDAERESLLANDPAGLTPELLRMLASQSDRAYASADYPRALSLTQSMKLVAQKLKNRNEESNAWHNIGVIYFLQRRYIDALDAYQSNYKLELELGRTYEMARALNGIGLVKNTEGKYKEAIDYFQRSLAINEELKLNSEIAQAYDNIGNAHSEQGNYTLATEFYEKSAIFYEANGEKFPLLNQLLKIAQTEYEQGNDFPAINYYLRALSVIEKSGEKNGRGHALHSIANIYYAQGDYPQALEYYRRSLKAEEEAGNKQGAASALQGIGLVHSLNGNHRQALDAYRKNLELAQSLDSKTDLAQAFQKTGNAHYNLLNYAEALAAYQKALVLREEIGDSLKLGEALLEVGGAFAALGEFSKALEHYGKAKGLFESIGNLPGVASALIYTSVIHYAQNDYIKSLEIAAEAAKAATLGKDYYLLWQARHREGKAHYRLKQYDQARSALSESISTIETKLSEKYRRGQPRFYESTIAPYLAMVDVLISQDNGNDAFNFAERAKARAMLGILQSAKVWINKTMTKREMDQERGFLTQLSLLERQIFREEGRDRPNQARIDELNERSRKAQIDYQAFKKKLFILRPQLKVLRGEGKPLTAAQAATLLNSSKSALLSFVETDERLYLFAFTKESLRKVASPSLKVYALETNRDEMTSRLSNFRREIEKREGQDQLPARVLYDLLIAPAKDQLRGKTDLVIIPDGVLWGLPFQALQSPDGRYLIEHFALLYTSSMTAYSSILNPHNMSHVIRKFSPALLAIGNPALSDETIERIKTVLVSDLFIPPPATQNEVEALGSYYGRGQAQVLSGAEAREDRIKVEAGKYNLLHFATNCVLNESSPFFSAIALSQSAASDDDGLLEARELINLDLKTKLIIISASEMTTRNAGSGRALTGMMWSSFIAGCPAIFISQWRTNSSGTAGLMLDFHRNLRSSPSKARAWQLAVKQNLAQENYRSPFFWAGFELFGDGR